MPADLATKLDRVARQTRMERRPIELVQDLLGTTASGIPDLGQRHRDYLLKRLRRAR
jgi:hypothetical protein